MIQLLFRDRTKPHTCEEEVVEEVLDYLKSKGRIPYQEVVTDSFWYDPGGMVITTMSYVKVDCLNFNIQHLQEVEAVYLKTTPRIREGCQHLIIPAGTYGLSCMSKACYESIGKSLVKNLDRLREQESNEFAAWKKRTEQLRKEREEQDEHKIS